MKVWIENNITSLAGKTFRLVDVVEVLSNGNLRVRNANGVCTVYTIGCLNKGPIAYSLSNYDTLNSIIDSQRKIEEEIKKMQTNENLLNRITVEEINNDPDF